MNNFEKIKAMDISTMAEFFYQRASVCELEKLCKDCINAQWCSADSTEDFAKWLESENE